MTIKMKPEELSSNSSGTTGPPPKAPSGRIARQACFHFAPLSQMAPSMTRCLRELGFPAKFLGTFP